MFWSAAMDLKTQRPLSRPSYGSFNPRAASTSISNKNSNSSSNSSSFYIPQSIPEHQLVSQFTSPVAPSSSDFRRGLVDEYVEGPRTAFARMRALLQRPGNTHTALKQLLQTDQRRDVGPALSTSNLTTNSSRPSSTQRDSDGELLQPLLLKLQARQEPNPQEDSDEHNYWMQELARRRAGLKRSRRRTCSSASTTTSPLRVGVVMCSVPLVLVLGFVVFVVLFGQALDVSSSSSINSNSSNSISNSRYRVDSGTIRMQEELREAEGEARVSAAGMETKRTSESVTLAEEIPLGENESFGLKLLDVPTDQSRLRGVRMDGVVQ